MSARSASDQRLQQITVTSIATLLLAVAGIVGLKQPEVTLWAVFLAGVCYTFAIHKDLAFKNAQTVGIIIALFVASVGAQIWLIGRHREQQQKLSKAPVKVVGSATTNAPGSVANTGTIGSVSITSDGDGAANRYKPASKPK